MVVLASGRQHTARMKIVCVSKIILARGLWMKCATMRVGLMAALAKQEQIAKTAERAIGTSAYSVEKSPNHYPLRPRLRTVRPSVQVMSVSGLSMMYATRWPMMISSQIAQMEQIAPIAATVTYIAKRTSSPPHHRPPPHTPLPPPPCAPPPSPPPSYRRRGVRFKTLCIGFEPNA